MTDNTAATPPKPTSFSGIQQLLDGKKTYITLAIAAVVIALNHFGFWPQSIFPLQLDPANWISDEWTMVLGAGFRSAVGKIGS